MQKQTKKEYLILGLILLTAAFLRLYRIDVLMRFIWDEGRDMLAIRNIIVNHDLTLFGPFNEIAGHKDFFGVFHYYLMLPALWLANFDPTSPAIFTALLGVVTIGLIYVWLKKWQDQNTALAITAIMAVSPLTVRFNQWAWNPNTVGFFAIIYLLALQSYQKGRNKWWLALAGLSLGLLFQLHYFTIALSLAAGLIFFGEKKKNWQAWFLFVITFVLPNLTFLIFDLTHAGFYRQIVYQSFFGQSGQKFVVFSWQGFLLGPFQYLLDISSKFLGSQILGFGLAIAWIFQVWQNLKVKKVDEKTQLIIAWIFFLLFTSFFPKLLDDYHSAVLWPSLAIALVLTLQQIFSKHWPIMIGCLLIWLIYANRFWRVPNWQENMPKIRAAALAIAEDAKQQNEPKINVASLVDPETRGIRFRYFIINAKQNLLGFDDYPQTQILYAITPHSWEETIKNPAWELNTFRQASAAAIYSDGEWTVFRVKKD